MEGLIVDWHLC